VRADQAANATVSGVVIDQSNGLPLGNADVVLFFDERKASQTTSDPQGRFTFSGEAPGSYYVEVRRRLHTDAFRHALRRARNLARCGDRDGRPRDDVAAVARYRSRHCGRPFGTSNFNDHP
jgi:hypothetical protein